MSEKKRIEKTVKDLCAKQIHFLFDYPKREMIPVYDWQLDLEQNLDFAIWEMQIQEDKG